MNKELIFATYEALLKRGLTTSKASFARDWCSRPANYLCVLSARRYEPSVATLHCLYVRLREADLFDLAIPVQHALTLRSQAEPA